MRRVISLLLVLLGFGGFGVLQVLPALYAAGPHVALLKIDGAIQPTSASFLSRGIDVATDEEARIIVVQLDTPGGLLSSTRDMVADILASDIPVVVYVAPPGSRAASAGTFITAAAHVAAMAPTTNIGAASPVGGGGEDLPETLNSKATQDAAAFIRGIAEERGRNSQALEDTVLNALSYSATEALENNIIDLIAQDLDELLSKLDGMTVQIGGGELVLELKGLEVREINRTAVERFIGFLADSNVAFLLLTLGSIGIMVEVFNPGLIVPGVFGAIALALAFLALGNLPVNWVGVGLIGLGMLLFFFEMQAPGIGVFGVSGAISFVLGAFLLFGGFSSPPIPSPSFRVSIWVIAGISAVLFSFQIFMLRAVLQARRAPRYPTGTESLVGQTGTATTALSPRGTVQVASELWSALSDSGEPIPEGEQVIVSEVEGLTLKVFKASAVN